MWSRKGEARAWVSSVATLLVNADGFNVPERSICRGVYGEPRSETTGVGDQAMPTETARELGRASSFPVGSPSRDFPSNADQCGVTPVGVDRDTKAPRRKGPRLRRVDPLCARKSGGDR